VENLLELNLWERSTWLAYLSACSTGETQIANLQDEAIHLIAACQVAGFWHVIGSLWEASDRYSVDATEEVYRALSD
jgi:CHAT domain-containing protein